MEIVIRSKGKETTINCRGAFMSLVDIDGKEGDHIVRIDGEMVNKDIYYLGRCAARIISSASSPMAAEAAFMGGFDRIDTSVI